MIARINAQRKQSSNPNTRGCCPKRNQTSCLRHQNFSRSCNIKGRRAIKSIRKNLKPLFYKHIAKKVSLLRKISFNSNRNQFNGERRLLIFSKSKHEVRISKNEFANSTLNPQKFQLMASRIYNRNVLSKHKRTSVSCRNTDTWNCVCSRQSTINKIIKIVNFVIVSSNSAANLNSLFTANCNNSVNMAFFCKPKSACNYLRSRTFCKFRKNKTFYFAVNQRLHNLTGELCFVEHRVHNNHIA